ncbi:MmgE/PrpD family protein [Halobellus sp. Atlit-38R]|uniref:MmgE/PrpD family protein n=1 Tax=Halobellus sp. Atlit-38R TaxID=2282131 RepID=UPI000EF1B887|nr:MmgE/PrpD family protein [Halobellus sp. Atlit-38R]RLM89352.1 MmgE/PrpD family protein [Halobellus sp. Atlit-38R]
MTGQDDADASAGTAEAVSFVLSDEVASAPETAIEHAERSLKDTLGAITAGHQLEETQRVTDYAFETFTEGEATVLDGSGRKIGTEGAVLANAVAANALDIDEGHLGSDGHPAAIVVPGAVAVAEEQGSTVRELVEATLVGYEVAVRAGTTRPKITGYHTGTGSWGPLGTAAAVARLRGLTPEATSQALAIADFNAPITPILRSVANPGSGLTKDGIGWGAYVGITAVEMAERGLVGSGTSFDDTDVAEPTTLGSEYTITEQYYKPYPGCRWIHAGIDAARELRQQYEFDPAEIEAVRVHTFENAIRLATRKPKTADAAEYSYPYELAVALRTGNIVPTDLDASAREDDAVLDLAEKVTFVHDEDLEARYDEAWLSQIEVETEERTYASDVTYPRGSEQRPLTDEEFRSKLRTLVDGPLGRGTADAVSEVVADGSASVDALLAYWST